jgi:hypothetical protein
MMKLGAVTQRGARKDFLDVYALGLQMVLPHMLGLTRGSTESRTSATRWWRSPTSTTRSSSR